MSEEIKKQDLQGEGEECAENTAKTPETDVKETKESKENEKKKKDCRPHALAKCRKIMYNTTIQKH